MRKSKNKFFNNFYTIPDINSDFGRNFSQRFLFKWKPSTRLFGHNNVGFNGFQWKTDNGYRKRKLECSLSKINWKASFDFQNFFIRILFFDWIFWTSSHDYIFSKFFVIYSSLCYCFSGKMTHQVIIENFNFFLPVFKCW